MPRRQHLISTKRALNEKLAPDAPEALKGCNRQLATCDGLIHCQRHVGLPHHSLKIDCGILGVTQFWNNEVPDRSC